MVIREVSTKKELKAFIQFPKTLYKDCPCYIPPLDKAERDSLTIHPALEFCDLRLWLAWDGDRVVGRVAGIINRKCNLLKEQRRVRFGWFDTVEDVNVAAALLQAVEQWGKSQGMDEICGPSRFSNMDRQSMLVEGFDHPSSIASDYNYPYYPKIMSALGFEKEVDYVQYKVEVKEVPETIERLAQRIQEKQRVRIRHFNNKKELLTAGREFFKVLNASYHKIFNFIPLTDKEIDWVIQHDFALPKMDLISVLEDENGKMIGISFCMPSMSEAFRKNNGRLFPFGWVRILRAYRHNKYVDMFLTGVLPEYANSGVHVLYHKQLNEAFLANHYEYAFTSQQLEDNPASRIWSRYASEPYCKRRCYRKEIR